MKRARVLVCAALLIWGACSSEGGQQAGPIGNTAGTSPMAGGAAGSGIAGTLGVAGSTAIGGAGQGAVGSPAAGSGVAGRAGSAGTGGSVAGAGAAGVAGAAVAGMGAAGMGAAGMAAAGGPAVAGAGAAGMSGGAAGGGAAGSGGATAGSVMLQFTTVSYRGEYAPLNYGAVWFERGDGGFVKTAKRWAGAAHASDLVAWTMASGGWGSILGGGNREDMMDAVSSATIRTHQMHTVTWNMMDAQKQVVPDGEYVAVIEMSESRARDRAGPLLRIKFAKGTAPQTVEVPNEPSFTGVVLRYTP